MPVIILKVTPALSTLKFLPVEGRWPCKPGILLSTVGFLVLFALVWVVWSPCNTLRWPTLDPHLQQSNTICVKTKHILTGESSASLQHPVIATEDVMQPWWELSSFPWHKFGAVVTTLESEIPFSLLTSPEQRQHIIQPERHSHTGQRRQKHSWQEFRKHWSLSHYNQ